MRINWSLLALAGGLLATVVIADAKAGKREPGAILVTPKQNAKVERRAELIGKALVRGWPIVLVRADQPDSLWWVQEPVEGMSQDSFKTKARFGNDKTPPGTAFRVIVLIVQSAEEAKQFNLGDSLKTLPPNLPCSVETVVVLERKDEVAAKDAADQVAGVILSPKPQAHVTRKHEVTGRAPADLQPVVLVRSSESNSPWWVQARPAADAEGLFQSAAQFGNEKTPAGSEFRIVVLLTPKGGDEAFKIGAVFKELPPGVPRSAEVRVRLASGSQASALKSEVGAAGGGE